MTTTRRTLFQLAGGAAAGFVLTPLPWRLLTDTALISETWPGVPVPKQGEVSYQFGHCSLCPAGCAVRARCVNGQPVSLTGVAADPLSHGALCAIGIAGHHIPYHPERLRKGPVNEAGAAVKAAIANLGKNQRVAVLDLAPGRTASETYRRAMAEIPGGLYLAPGAATAAVNLAEAKTVLSLGAPVCDGWGTPGNVMQHRAGFRLIQAEPMESRTTIMADRWLMVKPGTEEALAAGIAAALQGRSASEAAAISGIGEAEIVRLAQELKDNGPALVLDGNGHPHALNAALGVLGKTVVGRRETPSPESWKKRAPVADLAQVADGSIQVLLIDESVPGDWVAWQEIAPKLTPASLVVTFAWTAAGYGKQSQYTLPTAVYPEVAEDIPAAIDSPAATFRLAAAMIPPPAGVVSPAEFVAGLVGIDGKNAQPERAEAILKSGRGSIFDPATGTATAVAKVKPADFWKQLKAGAKWIDDADAHAAAPVLPAAAAVATQSELPLTIVSEEPRMAGLVSPLMSKLRQESGLRLGAHGIAMNPADARAAGLSGGGRARFQTAAGWVAVDVTVDESVTRGAVLISGAAEFQNLSGAQGRAKVVRS